LVEKFHLFNALWSLKVAGELNGQYVKLAKWNGSDNRTGLPEFAPGEKQDYTIPGYRNKLYLSSSYG
jgi:hypothetical protein